MSNNLAVTWCSPAAIRVLVAAMAIKTAVAPATVALEREIDEHPEDFAELSRLASDFQGDV